jgi:uncharacterized protein (TIGR00725 family)
VYQFCVSGAAKGESVEQGKNLAMAVGEAIAKAGHSLLTGATTGLPNYAAIGYKKAGGKNSVGLSPAATKVEHVIKYRLPTESYDSIIYTGLHYVGRDSLLITSADAVISIGGRLGTLHEFTIAMETETPIGFLQGAGGISEEIQKIVDLAKPLPRGAEMVFGEDPEQLVAQLCKILDAEHKKYHNLY